MVDTSEFEQGSVDVSTDHASVLRAIQALPLADPLAAKDMLFLIAGSVGRDRVQVQKAGFTGIALFGDFDLDTDQGCFVGEHVNKTSVRNAHEVLIVVPPSVHFLFP
jgi:hypothetical protein